MTSTNNTQIDGSSDIGRNKRNVGVTANSDNAPRSTVTQGNVFYRK